MQIEKKMEIKTHYWGVNRHVSINVKHSSLITKLLHYTNLKKNLKKNKTNKQTKKPKQKQPPPPQKKPTKK